MCAQLLPRLTRNPRTVIGVWLSLSLITAVVGFRIGLRTELPGPSSRDMLMRNEGERIAFAQGIPPEDTLLVILSSPQFTIDSGQFVAAQESLTNLLRSVPPGGGGEGPLFRRIQTVGSTLLDPEMFISPDRKKLFLLAETSISVDQSARALKSIPAALESWRAANPSFRVNYVSAGTGDDEIFDMIESDLDSSLIYTIPLTLIILIQAFGSLVAASIPLFIALVSLASSLGCAALISHIGDPLSATASQLVVLLVLAVGVDYSLFVITRVREEVGQGRTYPEAVAVARRTTGISVLWSGLTVAISLSGLFLMGDSLLSSMALISIVAVMITVIGSVVVLPSLITLLGNRINSVKLWTGRRDAVCSHWIVQRVLRRPALSLVVGSLIVLALGIAARDLRLGTTVEPKKLPQRLESAQAFKQLEESFPNFAGTDFSIIVRSPAQVPHNSEEITEEFIAALAQFEGVRGPLEVQHSDNELVSRYSFLALGSGNDLHNRELTQILRSDVVPRYLEKYGYTANLSGTLPFVYDEVQRYRARTPLVCAAVLLLSFIFLLFAFRSIVVPLKALALNTLSTLASFGVLTIAFQSGIIASWNYGVIETFVPPLLFAILFGLSMDYHVLILSRVREEYNKGASTTQAVERGIYATSGVITNAALIMVSVFAIIATLELPVMKELGFGLGFAVFLDATIVRSVLLPSSMVLLGRLNWYLPRFLERLPKLDLN